MVIGILTPFENNHGGGEVFIDKIVEFNEKNNDGILLKLFSSDECDHSVSVYNVPSIKNYSLFFKNYKEVIRIMKEEQVSAVILNDIYLSQFSFIFKKYFKHVISLIHGEIFYNRIKNRILSNCITRIRVKLIENYCDKILSVNHRNLTYFKKNSKIVFIGNFIDSLGTVCDNVKKYDFLFVGRFVPLKNINRIVNAFELYLSKVDSNASLALAGDGELYKDIEQRIIDKGLQNNVHLLGRVDHTNMAEVYSLSKCLLLFSETEGFPTVILEALQMGLPTVATDVGSNCKIIQNGENGYLFDLTSDDDTVVELMKDALSIKSNACVESCKQFDINAFYGRFISILNDICI